MKQESQEEFQLQDIQKTFKQKVFQASRNFLMHCETVNPLFINLFILVEALQILWFSIHPALTPLKNPAILEYVRTALSYINFQTPIATNNDLLLPFVILSFGIVVIYIITLTIAVRLMGEVDRHNSEFFNIVNRLAAFEIILFNTILTIPIFNVSAITLYCDNKSMYHVNRKCYDPTHIILCVMASLNVLVIIVNCLLYWFVFYLRNPFSKSYYALYNNLFRLGKLILKILPPLYFVIDVSKTFQSIYTVIFVILAVVYIGFFRISSVHNFYENYFYFEMFMEAVVAWFCINAVIYFQISSSGMNFILSTLCSFVFAYAVCSVQAEITRRFFMENLNSTVKKQDRQKFVYLLIGKLFQQSWQDINPLVYIKILNSTLDSPKVNNFLNRNDLKQEQVQQVSREVMLALLDKFLVQAPSINLRLVKCQLLFDCGLRILSLHEVSELRNEKLQTYEQFMIYNFKSTHNAFESGEMKGSEDNITEIETYLNFIENMNEFEAELQSCALNNEQYWEELCEDAPSSNKIYNLAKRSMKYTRKIEEMFKKIEEIFPQNLSALILYFQFLNDVCVRYKECNKIKEKLNLERQRQSQKQSSELENHNLKIKFKANERMCVLHVSTINNSMGIVQNCNSEVKKYLGFEKSELINQKVTKIMPKIYSDIHDGFIDDYLKKADATKLPVQKTVFAFKKNLKIIETCLAVKIFPNVLNGFQLVGFFKQKNTKQDIANLMINMKTLEIQGMTEGFLQMTGNKINLTEIQKQPLKLSHLFPQIDPNHKFTKGQTISTLFRFSDCTDRLIDFQNASAQHRKKFQKRIFLQVQGVHYYQGSTEIGVLTIKQQQELVSLHDTDKLRPSDPKLKPQRTKAKYQKRQVKSFADSASQDQISIERKIQDFISTQSNETKIFFLLVAMVFFFFAIILSSVLLTFVKTSSNYDQQQLLQELSLASNISIIEGKILSLNKDMTEQSHNPTVWNEKKALYTAVLTQLQTTIITLFQKANERKDVDLTINTFTHYSFFTKFKGSDKFTETSLYYTDGIQQAVFLAKSMINEVITNFNEPVSQNVYETTFFVQSNFKEMLPKLANQTVEAYRVLLDERLEDEFLLDVYIVSGKAILFIIFYFILCFFLVKFSSFNKTIVEIYNHILKWDAYELYSKCVQFRQKSLEISQTTSHDTPRSSDVFKVFPKSLLVLLSQGILNRNSGEAKTSIMANLTNSRQKNNSIERNRQQQQPFTAKGKTERKLDTPNKADLIHLSVENKMKKKFIAIFFILLVLMGINFIFINVNSNIKFRMASEIKNTLDFSSFSKSFLFLYFYGSQYIDGKLDYLPLYNKELIRFYTISKEISVIIGDNQVYLQDVYREIELLNSMVRGDLVNLDLDIKKTYIGEMESKLFTINDKIVSLSSEIFSNASSYLDKDKQTMRLLKMGVEIIIVLIFYKVVQVYLFSVVRNLIIHSSNMMKMVPTWIVHKSKMLRDIVCGNVGEQKEKQKKTNMDSSANMMMNSSV